MRTRVHVGATNWFGIGIGIGTRTGTGIACAKAH
jgi:hypothetical protein